MDAFVQGDEPDAHGRQFIEQRDQVSEATAQPVKTPAHQRVDLATARSPK